MDKSDIPKIIHKYISLFDNEEAYNAAFSNFEEVNWSAIKPSVGSEETPDKYRASRRLSNMYRKNNPPSYKFDNIDDFVLGNKQIVEIQDDGTKKLVIKETNIYADAAYIAKHNTNGNIINNFTPDAIRKTFFLEIVWGVFGWEWHDYEIIIGVNEETEEPIIETLKGGNLYKIKEIQTVPHIIDGHRLQHINDFLNSQTSVTKIEGFRTYSGTFGGKEVTGLIAANRAFKRGSAIDSDYPRRIWNNILECHLVDAYDAESGELLDHYFGYENTLDALVEADGLFYNNKIYVGEGDIVNVLPINIPNITHINRLYSYGAYTPNLKFKMESLISLTAAFKMAIFKQNSINLNSIFIGNTLNHLISFSDIISGASFVGDSTNPSNTRTVSLDLTNSVVGSDEVIDLSYFANWIGPSEPEVNGIVADTVLDIDLNFNNKVNLTGAFANISRNKNISYDEVQYIKNGGFERIVIDFNNKENYITSLDGAFVSNIFKFVPNVISHINPTCSENEIYKGCTFNVPMTYDFSPTHVINESINQFSDATFNVDSVVDGNTRFADFNNVDAVRKFVFENVKFGADVTNKTFPFILHNSNYYDEYTKWRYISFQGSQLTGIAEQNIYINYLTIDDEITPGGIYIKELNIFRNCANIDFTSGLHLYVKDLIPQTATENINVRFDFTGNTAMTRTPIVHFIKDVSAVGGHHGFSINCNGLINLVYANFEYFSVPAGGNNGRINFSGCTNLRYLKIGTQITAGFRCEILDLTDCASLDIPTLCDTLMKVNSMAGEEHEGLFLHRDIYDALESSSAGQAALAHVRSVGGNIHDGRNN